MNPYEFGGTHVICDVSAIRSEVLNDTDLISGAIVRGIRASGATLCGMQVKEFEPSGMTAVYLLSESHVSVHTYPDSNSLFFDAFTCGDGCSPQAIVDELLATLGSCEHRTNIVRRGLPSLRANQQSNWRESSIAHASGGKVVPLAPESQLSASTATG
jgi:S-adenosylmethionine decarboxylase